MTSGHDIVIVGPPKSPHLPGLEQVGLDQGKLVWLQAETPEFDRKGVLQAEDSPGPRWHFSTFPWQKRGRLLSALTRTPRRLVPVGIRLLILPR